MSPDPSLLDHLGFKFPSRKHRKGHRSLKKKTKHAASEKPRSPTSNLNPPTIGQEEPPIGQEDFSPTPPVEDASYNLFERPNVNILADMQETLQAAGISLQPRQVAVERFNVTYEVLDLPPSPTPSVEMDPDDLCCFCDEILPKNPSAAFLKANKSLRALPEVRARNESKNPLVLYLPVSLHFFMYIIKIRRALISGTWQFGQRAEHCQLHEAELSTIPDGINRGWPTQIDFDQLFR
ncbi:hypothetical protein MJO29_015579 [Puccinia striiformis f. sp. tritici]|nr:hypothetical protein MJO29_015579 [Puccinia striiformis f. sp. tritici]